MAEILGKESYVYQELQIISDSFSSRPTLLLIGGEYAEHQRIKIQQ